MILKQNENWVDQRTLICWTHNCTLEKDFYFFPFFLFSFCHTSSHSPTWIKCMLLFFHSHGLNDKRLVSNDHLKGHENNLSQIYRSMRIKIRHHLIYQNNLDRMIFYYHRQQLNRHDNLDKRWIDTKTEPIQTESNQSDITYFSCSSVRLFVCGVSFVIGYLNVSNLWDNWQQNYITTMLYQCQVVVWTCINILMG